MSAPTHRERGKSLGYEHTIKSFRRKINTLLDDLEAGGIDQVVIKIDKGNDDAFITWTEPVPSTS